MIDLGQGGARLLPHVSDDFLPPWVHIDALICHTIRDLCITTKYLKLKYEVQQKNW